MSHVLRISQGPDEGRSVVLQAGENVVGQSPAARLRLQDEGVSWEHVVLHQDGGKLMVENRSALGTLVNSRKVVERVRVQSGDRIRVSPQIELRVESPAGKGGWVGVAAWVVLPIVAIGAVVLMVTAGAAPEGQDNWNGAFVQVERWIAGRVGRAELPADALELFRNGWRLEQSGDNASAAKAWGKLNLLLVTSDGRAGGEVRKSPAQIAEERPEALNRLLRPGAAQPPPDEAEQGAATWQFVTRSLKHNLKLARSNRE